MTDRPEQNLVCSRQYAIKMNVSAKAGAVSPRQKNINLSLPFNMYKPCLLSKRHIVQWK